MSEVKMIGPIPQIGYGTWRRDDKAAFDGVSWALEAGYRHIDTAEGYGNEAFVGKGIEEGGVPRKDIFLTTKVAPEHFGPGQIRPHVEASLERLRTDRVDLLLLHWPSRHHALEDYVAQLAEVKTRGLTRHIGVSNFTKALIDRAEELLGEGEILTNQVEIHPLMQNRPIVDHCRTKGIATTAYCPLARGELQTNETLKAVGDAQGATVAQVALAFLMAEGHIVIPSSSNRKRIEENLGARDVVLTAAEIERIRGLDAGRRLVDGDWCPEWDV